MDILIVAFYSTGFCQWEGDRVCSYQLFFEMNWATETVFANSGYNKQFSYNRD